MKKIINYVLVSQVLLVYTVNHASIESYSALESTQTPLMQAAAHDNLAKLIEELEEPGINVNVQDQQGRTAIFIAAQEGKADNVKELLKHKADINIADNDGMTPLQVAVTSGDSDTVNALLDACTKGGSCPALEQRDKKLKFTPSARAARSGNQDIIKLLLAAGANPVAQVKTEDKNVAATSLYKGEDKEVTDLLKSTAQEYTTRVINALEKNNPEEAKKLITAGIDVNVKDKFGNSLLDHAANKGFNDIVEILIKAGADVSANDESYNLFYVAARDNNSDLAELLIKAGADINASPRGTTPLHNAASFGNKKMVQLLIDNNADVNAKDKEGNTPLHKAAAHGEDDIVKILIDNKADVHAKNINGTTPLWFATHYRTLIGRKNIIEMLKKAGAMQ